MLLILFSALLSATLAFRRNSSPRQADSSPTSNKYIIKLKSDVTTTAVADLKASLSGMQSHEYFMPDFRGFASTLTTEDLALLRDADEVCRIEILS